MFIYLFILFYFSHKLITYNTNIIYTTNASYNANITYSTYITYNTNISYKVADITYNTTVSTTTTTTTHKSIVAYTTDTITMMFIVELIIILEDPSLGTGRLHDEPIKVSNVFTSSIKTFLESPRLAFQGYISYSIRDVAKELGNHGFDVNNSNKKS